MEITHAFLAELAKADPAGKVNAIGIFNQVWGYDFPVKLPSCTLVVMLDLTGDDLSSSSNMSVRLRGGEPEEVYIMEETPMNFPPPPNTGEPISAQVTAGLHDGPEFSSPGVYTLELFINHELKYATTFRVFKKDKESPK